MQSETENWKPQFNIFPESLFSQNSNVEHGSVARSG